MSILDLVGNTPLCDLTFLLKQQDTPQVRWLAKLEGDNPGGSVKDRAAKHMIQSAITRGELKPGMRLIEATSGNTGIALAMSAKAAGIDMHLALPSNSSIERAQTMRAYGATVHLIDFGIEAARDFADEQVRATAGQDDAFFMLDQFSNPDNPGAHYTTTGPEIWRDTEQQITHFVSAMGTTGTIMGTSRYLKEQDQSIEIIGCQPTEGSSIPGIRRWPAEYLPKIFEPERVDRIIDVSQIDAENTARYLAKEAGLFIGISSGGAAWSAMQVANELINNQQTATVISIVCDRGDRYLSTGVFEKK